MADDSAGTTMPFVHLRNPVSPPSLFQDAERPDKCLESALLALYVQSDSGHVRTHPFPPLPLCMLLLLSYTRSRVAAKGHLFGGDTVCPRNNVDVGVLNLSIGGVARTRSSPSSSSSQLSNTGIHPSLKIPPLPPFLKDLWCSRNSLTGGWRGSYNYTTLVILTQDTGAPSRARIKEPFGSGPT